MATTTINGSLPLSGELFDLTITSYNNKFGKEKIDCSIENGIRTPISKYIKELLMITGTDRQLDQDDKTSKRRYRLEFLQVANTYETLQNYFIYMMRYLNGESIYTIFPGAGVENAQGEEESKGYIPPTISTPNQSWMDNNFLIFTIAGGNIIVIFAKLIQEIMHEIMNETNVNNLSLFNTAYTTAYNTSWREGWQALPQEFMGSVNNVLMERVGEQLRPQEFSDFDYNLLPNKTTISQQEYRAPVSQQESQKISIGKLKAEETTNDQGFVLYRIKSSLKWVNRPNFNQLQLSSSEDARAGKIATQEFISLNPGNAELNKISNLLFPQGYQNYFNNQFNCPPVEVNADMADMPVRSWEYFNPNICKFLHNLKRKKDIIKQETIINTKAVISVFNDTNNEITSIMKYINTITGNFNALIAVKQRAYEEHVNKHPDGLYAKIRNDFKLLSTIISNKFLTSLCMSFMTHFCIGHHTYKLQDIINEIHEENRIALYTGTSEAQEIIRMPSTTSLNYFNNQNSALQKEISYLIKNEQATFAEQQETHDAAMDEAKRDAAMDEAKHDAAMDEAKRDAAMDEAKHVEAMDEAKQQEEDEDETDTVDGIVIINRQVKPVKILDNIAFPSGIKITINSINTGEISNTGERPSKRQRRKGGGTKQKTKTKTKTKNKKQKTKNKKQKTKKNKKQKQKQKQNKNKNKNKKQKKQKTKNKNKTKK